MQVPIKRRQVNPLEMKVIQKCTTPLKWIKKNMIFQREERNRERERERERRTNPNIKPFLVAIKRRTFGTANANIESCSIETPPRCHVIHGRCLVTNADRLN